MRINRITIHASATYPSMNIGAKEIRQWHLDRGWRDIGYHRVIRRDGTVDEGRPESIMGAHVKHHNRDNLGICLVGGLKEGTQEAEDNFTPVQYIMLTKVLVDLLHKHPEAIIQGHNGYPGHETRACPCFDWRAYVDYLNRAMAAPYRPSGWMTHSWKAGAPARWSRPKTWWHAVKKDTRW